MAQTTKIQLLGDFSLTIDDQPIGSAITARLQSLIAYLVIHAGAPQARSRVAFLFWPDSTEKQALTNLRHLLHELRKAIPCAGELVTADGRTLQWTPSETCRVDLLEFEDALQLATERESAQSGVDELERAVASYRGDLLPGNDPDWVVEERDQLRNRYLDMLQRLVDLHEKRRDYPTAIGHARAALRTEPTRESMHATLVRLHLLAGDRSAALEAYRQAVSTLENELAIGPGRALRELYERLLADEAPPPGDGHVEEVSDGLEFPLHGRQREWLALRERWTHIRASGPHLCVIAGEAGIGKSRLAEELFHYVKRQGGIAARTRSYEAEGRLPYAPAVQWLRTPAIHADLGQLDRAWLSEIARLLPELRQEFPDLPPATPSNESWQRSLFLEALSRAVLVSKHPRLLILDDLQWTDNETLEWLRMLLRHDRRAPLLILGAVRQEELTPEHPLQRLLLDLRRNGQVTQIQLGPLGEEQTRAIAAEITGTALDDDALARLHKETEGNALFIVETLRAGLDRQFDSGEDEPFSESDRERPGVRLPPKILAVIAARLAHLSPEARDLTGVAAVLGRAFEVSVLAATARSDEDEVLELLAELWQQHIIREESPNVYDFVHDKLREVAYAEIIPPRRRMLHNRAAEVLEGRHAGDLPAVSAQLAFHFTEAGLPGQAIDSYQQAADTAREIHANDEAVRLNRRALHVLGSLPPSRKRSARELAHITRLGVCLVEVVGYTSPEIWKLQERAVELCRELQCPMEPPLLRILAVASLVVGNLDRSLDIGHEFHQLHASTGDVTLQVEGDYILGVAHHWRGEFCAARKYLETAVEAHSPERGATHIALYAQDPGAVCTARLGWTLWFLGLADQAREIVEEAVAVAVALRHPHTEGYARYYAAQLYTDMRIPVAAENHLRRLHALNRKHPLHFWDFRGLVLHRFIRAETHTPHERIRVMRRCMAEYESDGGYLCFTHFLCYIAEIHFKARDATAGLGVIDEIFRWMERIGERHFLAETYRLRGELLALGAGSAEEVESALGRAIEIAREQGALIFELRATLGLAKFQRARGGSNTKPLDLVAETIDRFTEGFTTPDLTEARTFLETR